MFLSFVHGRPLLEPNITSTLRYMWYFIHLCLTCLDNRNIFSYQRIFSLSQVRCRWMSRNRSSNHERAPKKNSSKNGRAALPAVRPLTEPRRGDHWLTKNRKDGDNDERRCRRRTNLRRAELRRWKRLEPQRQRRKRRVWSPAAPKSQRAGRPN